VYTIAKNGDLMQLTPQTASVRELRSSTNTVIERTSKGPVFLVNRATPTAVIVSPDQWDATLQELARLRRIVLAEQRLPEMKAGHYVTHDELMAAINEDTL
jgi:prevent-host-death family protein